MALVLQDRVRELSTSTGTTTFTLSGAYVEYRTFASCVPNGSIVYYCINNTAPGLTEWEVGYGTYSSNTLTRTTVYSSTNSNTLVNFSAGDKEVFITQPAEQAVYQDPDGITTFPENYISVVGANATAPAFATTLSSFVSNVDSFSQLVAQNQSADANASSDVVAYNNLGDGASYFVDMGINSSTYNSGDYPIFPENSAYLFSGGLVSGTGAAGETSDLYLGTSTANSNVVVFGGSVNSGAEIATFVASTKNVNFANNISATSNVSANNVNITNFAYAGGNLSNAANSTVLVTQAYVDGAVSTGFVVHTPVKAVANTYTGSGATYNNGAGTITNNTNAAFGVIDGVTINVGDRVLFRALTNAYENGIYTLTDAGSVSTPWVVTRATDFDTVGPGEIANNAYVFVTNGTTYKGFSYVLSQLTSPIVLGTTALPFVEFASALVYTGTDPINVAGQTIALTGIVPVANGGTNLASYTAGDLLYANASTLTTLGVGSQYNVLTVSGAGVPSWGSVNLSNSNAITGSLGATNGGTGQTTYTLGDIIYSSAANTLSKLAGQTTTTKKYLQQQGDGVNSAAPSWQQIAAADISGLAPSATTDTTNADNITSGTLPTGRITGSYTGLTGTGNLTVGTWSANVIGATYGGTGVGGSLTGIPYANGSSAYTGATGAQVVSLIGTNAVANATYAVTAGTATNLGSGTAGAVPYQSGSGATTFVSIGGSGTILTSDGTAPVWTSPSSITANVATYVATTDDTTTATAVYPVWVSASSGNNAVKVSSTKITFTPSTGTLQTTLFSGSGANLTALNGSNVSSGTVGISYGGTGQTTANAAFNALAPSQTGNSGKFLTTDGANSSWGTVSVSAAGSSTQIQYNNGGAFAASANLTFDSTTDQFTAPNVVASNGLVVNNMTVGSSFSVPSGYSASSVGPITVGSGAVITLPAGSRWVVL